MNPYIDREIHSLNPEQKQAVLHTEGPAAIVAGPGTGKTHTLVTRLLYMIVEKNIKPEEIMTVTFTRKAANELVTRVSSKLKEYDIKVDISEMKIGTFHDLFLDMLTSYPVESGITKLHNILDEDQQKYLVRSNKKRFGNLLKDNFFEKKYPSQVDSLLEATRYANEIREELALSLLEGRQDLKGDRQVLSSFIELYSQLLKEHTSIDFSGMLYHSYRLLKDHPPILEEMQNQIKYIMVDEYQDTNPIQEQLLLMLAGERANLCVVGDDDQSIYRFRGATVSNLLQFKENFNKPCLTVFLRENYRSKKSIIDFYSEFMDNPVDFNWEKERFKKNLHPCKENNIDDPRVSKIISSDEENWMNDITACLLKLKESGVITQWNQVVYLTSGIKYGKANEQLIFNDVNQRLILHLEKNGIPVYAPRYKMFYGEKEIIMAIGCLLHLFPSYTENTLFNPEQSRYINYRAMVYYKKCYRIANAQIKKDEYLKSIILRKADRVDALSGLYLIMGSPIFQSWLNITEGQGLFQERTARNLSVLLNIVSDFEKSSNSTSRDWKYRDFFNTWLGIQIKNKSTCQYEDEREYAPEGCISFMTIHQSKGMEFPVVITSNFDQSPKLENMDSRKNRLKQMIRSESIVQKDMLEKPENSPLYDHQRLFYTAFSRAENLLILTAHKDKKDIEKKCPYLAYLPDFNKINLKSITSKTVKSSNLTDTWSYTTHVSLYTHCPAKYRFRRYLQFPSTQERKMIFGSLVHQVIEEVNLQFMEKKTPDRNFIERSVEKNLKLLRNRTNTNITKEQIIQATSQVITYVKTMKDMNLSSQIYGAEVKLSLADQCGIIEGNVDLILSKVEGEAIIVDFKTERKDDLLKPKSDPEKEKERRNHIESYGKQLLIYAYLVNHCTSMKTTGLYLYFTKEPAGFIRFNFTNDDINNMDEKFHKTIDRIKDKDFNHFAETPTTCIECEMKSFCKGYMKK